MRLSIVWYTSRHNPHPPQHLERVLLLLSCARNRQRNGPFIIQASPIVLRQFMLLIESIVPCQHIHLSALLILHPNGLCHRLYCEFPGIYLPYIANRLDHGPRVSRSSYSPSSRPSIPLNKVKSTRSTNSTSLARFEASLSLSPFIPALSTSQSQNFPSKTEFPFRDKVQFSFYNTLLIEEKSTKNLRESTARYRNGSASCPIVLTTFHSLRHLFFIFLSNKPLG